MAALSKLFIVVSIKLPTPMIILSSCLLIRGKEFPYDGLERFWQLDDVNMKPEKNGASERHANRAIYYINPNSDDHRVTYILKEYGIYWLQFYTQIYIWIIKLEGLYIQQFVNICGKDVADKDEKMKDGNQDYMDSDFTKVIQTLFANKVINIASQINVLQDEVRRKFINMSKSIQPEDTLANLKLLVDITTSSYNSGKEPIENSLTRFKLPYEIASLHVKKGEELKEDSLTRFILPYEIASLLGNKGEKQKELKNVSAGERSKQESTLFELYRNVMQNETCRMMTGIDMVVSESKRLFGNERTQIFFDLLDDGLFYFGLSGAAPGFIPNMTQSAVRQHVISFFEHSCDTMNRLMTLFLGCPDSKILQQMPEQHFISLMRSVIDSSLKTKTKGGKILSLKESTLIMVDSDEFERALGKDIPEDVLERLKRREEMVVHRFVDRRLEKTQASARRENRPIHSIYFPSDCRLFIYIPTENGSYWHQADMKRERVLYTNKINNCPNDSSR